MWPAISMTERRRASGDDGRVVADMSGVERRRLWLPRREEENSERPPWDQSGRWSGRERRSALWGALSASLLVGTAYAAGLGLVIFLLTLLFR